VDYAPGAGAEDCITTSRRLLRAQLVGLVSTGVLNTNALPRITIGTNVWGGSSIMTGVY
jgi:hypothetical protein